METKLKTLSEYIDKNEKLPSIRDIDDNVKLLAHFMYTQRQTYKSNTKIMKDPLIRKHWEDFTNIYSVYIYMYICIYRTGTRWCKS